MQKCKKKQKCKRYQQDCDGDLRVENDKAPDCFVQAIKLSERVIQRGVCDYLDTLANIYWFRAGSGAIKTETGRYFKTGKPGLSDIIVGYDGKFIALEVKSATGKQLQAQKKAEQDIKNAKCEYYIVRSISDVKEIFQVKGVPKKST